MTIKWHVFFILGYPLSLLISNTFYLQAISEVEMQGDKVATSPASMEIDEAPKAASLERTPETAQVSEKNESELPDEEVSSSNQNSLKAYLCIDSFKLFPIPKYSCYPLLYSNPQSPFTLRLHSLALKHHFI